MILEKSKPRIRRRLRRTPSGNLPALRFSPTAWAKLLFLREVRESEIGGFAITADDDPAYVEDVKLPRQCCTAVSVIFDDMAVADFFDEQVDRGLRPDRFARVWVHTHPGDCPLPSWLDELTFERVFRQPDWAVMFILAGGENSYARLRFNRGPGVEVILPVRVDHRRPFPAANFADWQSEYAANVTILPSSKDRSNNFLENKSLEEVDNPEMDWNTWREDPLSGREYSEPDTLREAGGLGSRR